MATCLVFRSVFLWLLKGLLRRDGRGLAGRQRARLPSLDQRLGK